MYAVSVIRYDSTVREDCSRMSRAPAGDDLSTQPSGELFGAALGIPSTHREKGYFPCAVILSGQIDSDILMRYRIEKWSVVTGVIGMKSSLISTYDFLRDVIGYDLAAFFERNSSTLRVETDAILRTLLAP